MSDQTECVHDQPRQRPCPSSTRPNQHGCGDAQVDHDHHHKKRIDGLPDGAKPEKGNARAKYEVLVVQSRQPPDAENGLHDELCDQFETAICGDFPLSAAAAFEGPMLSSSRNLAPKNSRAEKVRVIQANVISATLG